MLTSGAVYVFDVNSAGAWSQTAYIKPSYVDYTEFFGTSLSLTAVGGLLAVGAPAEDGVARGVNSLDPSEVSGSANASGAAFVFQRDNNDAWSQRSYVKASNALPTDRFGGSVVLSGDGQTLVVGPNGEDTTLLNSGAIYIY